ncbi:MAG: hypothetical protein KBS58_02440 [Bacteroidales bacterium]|nr:hypothetical protein [Candidatus Cacconaster equi]
MKGKLKEKIRKATGKAIKFLSGDILIEKNVDRHIGFVAYIFALVALFITWNLTVESKLAKVQENEKVIQELRISYQQRTLELVGMNNRTKIDRMLNEQKSTLHPPVVPPRRIDTEKK